MSDRLRVTLPIAAIVIGATALILWLVIPDPSPVVLSVVTVSAIWISAGTSLYVLKRRDHRRSAPTRADLDRT